MMDDDVRTKVLNLMVQKEKIEQEIRRHGEILAQNGVGMDDSLVDNEGYPFAHIDVYAVRNARKEIICLQNDYKALIKQIDNGLTEYYQTKSSTPSSSILTVQRPSLVMNLAQKEIPAFAKVVNVISDSPADKAGLQDGDLLLQFGSVNGHNFKDISSIAGIVQHSENIDISVIIKRDRQPENIRLKPQKWAGRGLLGCTLLPLENIDR